MNRPLSPTPRALNSWRLLPLDLPTSCPRSGAGLSCTRHHRAPSISSPQVPELRSIEANGSALKACSDSPPTQTRARLFLEHPFEKIALASLGKKIYSAPSAHSLKAAGLCPAPRSSPEGHAFKRHAWLTHCVARRPQCFNAASPRIYTIALNYFSSIYGGNVRIIHINP
jgi:hypothetical protein